MREERASVYSTHTHTHTRVVVIGDDKSPVDAVGSGERTAERAAYLIIIAHGAFENCHRPPRNGIDHCCDFDLGQPHIITLQDTARAVYYTLRLRNVFVHTPTRASDSRLGIESNFVISFFRAR